MARLQTHLAEQEHLQGKTPKQQSNAVEQQLTRVFDGASPADIQRLADLMELLLGDHVLLRARADSSPPPASSLVGPLLGEALRDDAKRFLQSSVQVSRAGPL